MSIRSQLRSVAAGLSLVCLSTSAAAQGADLCSNAQAISGSGAHNFVNNGANTDGPASAGCNFFGQLQIEADVWFRWTATVTGTATITTCGSTPLDSKIAAYAFGACPPTTLIDCSDDECGGPLQSTLSFPVTNGTQYLLRIGVFPGTATGAGQIVISQSGSGGSNDNCATPTVISGTGTFPFNNATATTDGAASALCNFFGQTQIEEDVWFQWTPSATGSYTVATCGQTTIDSKIAAYSGAGCPAGAPLACSDDDCGSGNLTSSITFTGTAGQIYMIRVGNFPGTSAGGAGNIVISTGGGGGNDCSPPSTGPDVIVGGLNGISKFGTVGTLTGYSVGTDSCNIGSVGLSWVATTNQHPVIGQNMYRLKNGRFEQLGMSWLKHGFLALNQSLCCPCNNPGTGAILGVGCSDPYDSSLNGFQEGSGGTGGLGPRSEVNPTTGAFPFPYGSQGLGGNAIYKRIQVENADLDPALNAGATYFAEGHYVAPDDALANNRNNNASYMPMLVGSFASGGWNLSLSGVTERKQAAIRAWKVAIPAVDLRDVQVDGLFIAGSHAIDNGNGTWRYEYAVYNMNSDRAAQALSVPVPAGASITGVGFHDVNSHSGEPYSTTDWASSVAGGAVSWASQTFAQNANANALRWGTLYNFFFTANRPPFANGTLTLTMFKPGTPSSATFTGIVPDPGSPPISAYCFGDGSNGACPCVNNGAAGNGCANSGFAGGANLGASGTASVAADTLVLNAANMTGSIAVFFQGATQVAPAVVDDGLGCVGGPIIRLGNKPAAGTSFYPQPGDPSVSVRGAIPAAGGTFFYQCFYRNAVAAFCPPATSNRTNGLQIVWAP